MAAQLISSTRTNLSEIERNILNITKELSSIDRYNLATGKLKKKYVKRTVLQKIQKDFKQLN
tara:strand:+ start:331 stop:516 length:186 start_codon:yes stop_codon:yes gene_type:complete